MVRERVAILNAEMDNLTCEELLSQLKSGVLLTPNVDQVVKMQSDKEYYNIVKKAEWVVCDSRILYLCSKITRHPLMETIPGSSFFPAFYEYHKNDENCRIYLLGAMDGVAQKAMESINKRVGREIVVGAYSPSYGFETNQVENDRIYEMINSCNANVVLVGVGCPKQEKWIDTHKANMPDVDIWMALGATIDFEAGNVKRAPKIWQKLALEWLYRMIVQPKRIVPRVIKDFSFFWYFFLQLIGKYKNPFDEQG